MFQFNATFFDGRNKIRNDQFGMKCDTNIEGWGCRWNVKRSWCLGCIGPIGLFSTHMVIREINIIRASVCRPTQASWSVCIALSRSRVVPDLYAGPIWSVWNHSFFRSLYVSGACILERVFLWMRRKRKRESLVLLPGLKCTCCLFVRTFGHFTMIVWNNCPWPVSSTIVTGEVC